MDEFQRALIEQLQGINDKLAILTARQRPIKAASQNLPKVSEEDVDEIYAAYPTKDERNNNRPLGKGAQSKKLIQKRLIEGWTKEDILSAIDLYVNGTGYLPNFNSFLNNLPCKEELQIEQKEEEQITLWQ